MSRSIGLTGACALAALSLSLAVAPAGCTDTTPSSQKLPIGSPCKMSSDCGTNPPFFCASDHPGGYCKRDCATDKDCPSGSICAHDGPTSGACHKTCDTVADCRGAEGYICKPSSSDPNTIATHNYCDAADAAPDDGGATDGAAGDGAPATDMPASGG